MMKKLMNEYKESWISTLLIPKFSFLDPQEADIQVSDIAHSLSLLCRFGGHCNKFYSVAEHSVLVARVLAKQKASELTQFAGLLHDAEEAYLPDIPAPIKQHMTEALEIYAILQTVIYDRFSLNGADWNHVKDIDKRICIAEAKTLGLWNRYWADAGPPLETPIFGWTPRKAEREFLNLYSYLNIRTGQHG